jgi:DNA-binding MarR family transcriptional regulator
MLPFSQQLIVKQGEKIDITEKLVAYLKYLKYEEDINDIYALEPIQLQVLNAVFFAVAEKRKIKVGDILVLKKIASPATIHAALKKLIDKKLVTYQLSKTSRAKFIELTNLGAQRYVELANKAQNSK